MKYCVENDLRVFEFHDSVFSLVRCDGTDLVISAALVNIRKDTAQNPSEHDMEIESAQICFRGFRTPTYEPGRVWRTGPDGQSHPVGPRVILSGQEAMASILDELRSGMTVFHFEKEAEGRYSIGGCGIEPYFTIEFAFDSVSVCWDQYKKKAWYELHRQYRFESRLHTPDGDEAMQLTVSCHEEPEPAVSVGCRYDGKEYWGRGTDFLWIDAFADLQRQLPAGVSLKCCLTCRHGNLCPVGNEPNELFCTKDVTITQKSDLFFYTEDENERENRKKQCCDVCADHQPQCEAYYTYNDFLAFLKQG